MRSRCLAYLLVLGFCIGCGQQSEPAPNIATEVGEQTTPPTAAIPASIKTVSHSDADQPQDSAEWNLGEIRRLRFQQPAEGLSAVERQEARRTRNGRIIGLATEFIRLTHEKQDSLQQFNDAVRQLLEARLQLAMQGNREDIELLYSDVAALEQEHPQSIASAAGNLALLRLSHTNAQRFGADEPDWLREFSRLARLYADTWPQESARSVPLLFAAGRSCELHGLLEDALPCFRLLRTNFPATYQGQQSVAIMRRLDLIGKPLQLEGSTIDGNLLSVTDFRKNAVVLYFWSSLEEDSGHMAERLIEMKQTFERSKVRFIGVNLDEDESLVDHFLERYALPGQQLFSAQPNQRRWDNPIARYYGVHDIPLVWFVDSDGSVLTNRANLDNLADELRDLVRARRQR